MKMNSEMINLFLLLNQIIAYDKGDYLNHLDNVEKINNLKNYKEAKEIKDLISKLSDEIKEDITSYLRFYYIEYLNAITN